MEPERDLGRGEPPKFRRVFAYVKSLAGAVSLLPSGLFRQL